MPAAASSDPARSALKKPLPVLILALIPLLVPVLVPVFEVFSAVLTPLLIADVVARRGRLVPPGDK